MGDSTDGPSSAAHRAQATPEPPAHQSVAPRQNFFRKLLSRLTGGTAPAPVQDGPARSDASADAGTRAMALNLRHLRRLRVADIAVPRADIVAVAASCTLEEVMDAYRESTLTRLPVFNETLDDPIGFLHLKDVALSQGFGAGQEPFDLRSLARRILFVPPSMPVAALLQRMQNTRIHIGLVVDEYGGVDGLVTIEDVLEQIVGEIDDEHDEEEAQLWREESPGVYLVSARAELHDFETVARVDLLSDELDEEVDTLGGLVFMLIGRIPERAEVVLHPEGHEFEIVDADPRRIKRLRVRIKSGEAQDIQKAAE